MNAHIAAIKATPATTTAASRYQFAIRLKSTLSVSFSTRYTTLGSNKVNILLIHKAIEASEPISKMNEENIAETPFLVVVGSHFCRHFFVFTALHRICDHIFDYINSTFF
jgi:hypothetical protein